MEIHSNGAHHDGEISYFEYLVGSDNVKRTLAAISLLLVASASEAAVKFIVPTDGSQTFGRQLLEVTTDAPRIDRVEFYVDGALVAVAKTPPYRASYDFGDGSRARSVSAKVISASYSKSEVASVRTAGLTLQDQLTVDLVEVPLRLRSSRKPASRDLAIVENGAPQEVLELRNSRGPTSFVFVVDRSLSMDRGKLEATQRAIEGQVRKLRPGDRASVVFFNQRVARPESVSRAADVARAFSGVVPSGGTSLRDALLSLDPGQRTTAIVISDGADRNSEASEETTLRKVARQNLFVHSILLGSGSAASMLRELSSRTGGGFERAEGKTLGEAMERIFAEINSRWVAVYQSTNHGAGWRSIKVTPRASGIVVITARKGYQSS